MTANLHILCANGILNDGSLKVKKKKKTAAMIRLGLKYLYYYLQNIGNFCRNFQSIEFGILNTA